MIDAVRDIARSDFTAFDLPWFGHLMRSPQLLACLIQVDTWLREYKVSIRASGPAAPARRRRTTRRHTLFQS